MSKVEVPYLGDSVTGGPAKFSLTPATPSQHTQTPYVTGTSLLGIKYKDGILVGSDMAASYGSTVRYKSLSRLHPVGKHVLIGASGSGNPTDLVVGTCLVVVYAKCGELEDARQVFDSMDTKNVVTWTALIAGYAEQGLGQEALVVYGQMEEGGLILADQVTLACLLKA